ncbi:hypothetical protein HPY86_00305 [candidate division WOR-3 bacterium]|nr:hypothetical protein [candidate division WOR-3 bacterium]
MAIAVAIGRFLFRWRGVIGFLAFAIVYFFGKPTIRSCLAGLPLIFAGLLLRFWAMGHIGAAARARTVGVEKVVKSGPYRIFPHPIYAGNFLLVLAVLVCLKPDLRLALGVVLGFLIEYGLIAYAEKQALGQSGLEPKSVKFDLHRALSDLPTWVVMAVIYLLCLVRPVWF